MVGFAFRNYHRAFNLTHLNIRSPMNEGSRCRHPLSPEFRGGLSAKLLDHSSAAAAAAAAALVILSAIGSFGLPDASSSSRRCRFIHTATLYRRCCGDSHLCARRATEIRSFAIAAAGLVGDFSLCALQCWIDVQAARHWGVFTAAYASRRASLMQLLHVHNPEVNDRTICAWSARNCKLFEAAGRLGAILAGAPPQRNKRWRIRSIWARPFQLVDRYSAIRAI